MPITVAHQYDAALATRVAEGLPNEVDFRALEPSPETAWKVPPGAEVLLVSPNSAVIGLHKDMPAPLGWPFDLQWVHLRSTGVDKYPDWLFAVPRVTVTRGGYAVPISEYVLAAMLAQVKSIPALWASGARDWQQRPTLGTLAGQTLGIIGFGEIGKAIARRALSFDMAVVGTRRTDGPSGMDGVEVVSLDVLLGRADHIVVAMPLTKETRGMLDAAAFARMKPGAHLINIARGAVVDENALRSALDGNLGGATLDVAPVEPLPDGHWLYEHPKVRISPHISGTSPLSDGAVTDYFLSNLERYRSGKELLGLVDPDRRY